MNSLFGRSKSKHRNIKGNLKDRIGNPTPIDPININGSFIDLKLNPQDGSASNGAGVPPLPHLPPIMTQNSPEEDEEEAANDDASITPDNQPHLPTKPRQDDGNTQVQEYLRGSNHGWEEFDDDVSSPSRSRSAEENPDVDEYYTRSHSPQRSPDSTRRKFSRPAADDEVGHSLSAPRSSRSASTPRVESNLTIRTDPRKDPGTPGAYKPYSPASPYTPRGRQPERPGRISPAAQQYQERGRQLARSIHSEKRSSSNYSAAASIDPPVQYTQAHRSFDSRHRPERIDIEPARILQQAETAKYFDADAEIEDSASPLQPPPHQNNPNQAPQASLEISPQLGPTTKSSSPGHLDLDLNKEDAGALDISFSEFSMPSPVMGAKDHLQITSPKSPEGNRLPAYLGKIQPVQRELDYGEPKSPPTENASPITSPKRSLSRKVSTKLRTLVGAGGRPREPLPENGVVAATTATRNLKGGLNKEDISNPIPILEKEQKVDPEIEEIMARYDMERGPPPTRMAEQIQDKVDDWNYNPSAASSTSNISLHPSYKSGDDATVTRNVTPDTPITPADDGYSFSALRGPSAFGDTMKSDTTAKQRDFLPPRLEVGRSEEVPVFLDTAGEGKTPGVPSFTHEPPTPEPHKTTFSRAFVPPPSLRPGHDSRRDDLQPGASGKQLRDSSTSSDVSNNSGFTRPSPTIISTPPTSVASSPQIPASPMSLRSPTGRRPPFGPGGPKMMLRTATMSSRPNGGAPLQPKPKPLAAVPSIAEDERTVIPSRQTSKASTVDSRQTSKASTLDSRQTSRANTPDSERNQRSGDHTPTSPYSRAGSPFSFMRDDISVIGPSDSASQIDPRSVPSSPRSGSPSFDFDRSSRQPSLRPAQSHSMIRPKTASRIQNDRVSTLSRLDTDLPPRPSTGTQGQSVSLRLNTDLTPQVTSPSASVVDAPRSPSSQTLQLPGNPIVKRSKSVGEGLRRAFTRRAPAPPVPSPTPPPGTESTPPLPEEPANGSFPTSPISVVSGPLGFGNGSASSKARWNTALRAAAVSSVLTSHARPNNGSSPSSPTSPKRSAANPNRASVVLKAQPLTAEERRGMHHAPGTLFIRTCEEGEDGIGACSEHRMKPRKGGMSQKCAFCLKGPFANMWVCLDGEDGAPEGEKTGLGGSREREEKRAEKCSFALCRMCCNERVQEGTAEIF